MVKGQSQDGQLELFGDVSPYDITPIVLRHYGAYLKTFPDDRVAAQTLEHLGSPGQRFLLADWLPKDVHGSHLPSARLTLLSHVPFGDLGRLRKDELPSFVERTASLLVHEISHALDGEVPACDEGELSAYAAEALFCLRRAKTGRAPWLDAVDSRVNISPRKPWWSHPLDSSPPQLARLRSKDALKDRLGLNEWLLLKRAASGWGAFAWVFLDPERKNSVFASMPVDPLAAMVVQAEGLSRENPTDARPRIFLEQLRRELEARRSTERLEAARKHFTARLDSLKKEFEEEISKSR